MAGPAPTVQGFSVYTNNVNVPSVDQNTTTAYTFVIQDAGQLVEMNNASPCILTIPPNSTAPFQLGTSIQVAQYGAGQITIAPGAGVTLRSKNGLTRLNTQYSVATIVQRALNEWYFSGDILAGATAIAAGTGAGTSPTVSVTGTDSGGWISVLTGTAPATSSPVVTITFSTTYAAAPRSVVLTPANSAAAALATTSQVFADQANITTTTFVITSGSVALAATTTYKWAYTVTP